MGRTLAAAGRGLISLLYSPYCFLCGSPLHSPEALCPECEGSLERFRGDLCLICGRPVPQGIDLCRDCAVEPRPYTFIRAVGPYTGALRAVVLGLKYGGERALAHPLAEAMAGLVPSPVDLVTYVPPDPKRGHPLHAARSLAREVARLLRTPLRGLLIKVRHTPSQTGLPREERLRNPRGAFRARARGRGETVLLVDDVLTTGATAAECCQALLEAGFGSVGVLVAARSLPDED